MFCYVYHKVTRNFPSGIWVLIWSCICLICEFALSGLRFANSVSFLFVAITNYWITNTNITQIKKFTLENITKIKLFLYINLQLFDSLSDSTFSLCCMHRSNKFKKDETRV